jgi:hypothetical protein
MYRRKFLYLIIGISVFLAAYLYYVKTERAQSVERYFNQPQAGDIYKIKSDDEEGDSYVTYWKVMQVGERGLVFAPGRFQTWSSVDYLQKHFNEMLPFSLSRDELRTLKSGTWNNNQHANATLLEIVRKQ